MNDSNKPGLEPYRWVVLIMAMLTSFVGSYAQFQLPPLAYRLMPALKLSPSDFAALMGGPMTGSIFVCLLGGNLADRFGVKKIVTVGLAFAVIGCTFRYAVDSFWPFWFLTVLAGLGSGLLVGNLSKLFGAWFPPAQMGTIMGICMVSPVLAMFLGTSTTTLFPSDASAFIFSGILCLITFILWLIFAKNKPDGAPDLPVLPVAKYLGEAARSRNIWFAGIGLFFIMGALMTMNSFLPNVLHDVRGLDPTRAGFYGSLATLGGIFGSFIGPLICNRIGVMKPYLVVTALLAAAGTFWCWQLPIGPAIIVGLIAAGFLQNAMMPMIASMPMLLPEIGPVYAGSAGGIITTLQVIGAVVAPTFIITPLAGASSKALFGMAALCFVLIIVPVLFLPELGSKALAARAQKASSST